MGLFDNLFGGSDPSKKAQRYLGQIPGTVKPYLDPYSQAGQRAIPGLEEQYGKLMGNPGDFINGIGAGYQKSPGYDFAMKQALAGARNASAAGGMSGSPADQQFQAQIAEQLANQDYNQWLQNALGAYGWGLQGEQGLYGGGLQAGSDLAGMLGQNLQNQAGAAYAGQANQNANRGAMWGQLGKLAGTLGGAALGGPFGGWLGSQMFGGNGPGGQNAVGGLPRPWG